MSDMLPQSVRAELAAALAAQKARKSRLRVRDGERSWPVLRRWSKGFALEAEGAPRLRGLVDLYEGSRHLGRCLIVAASEEAGEMHYEFKRDPSAGDVQPLDFERPDDVPIALLPR